MINKQTLKNFKKDWIGAEDGIWRFICQKCGEKSIIEDEIKKHKCNPKSSKYSNEQILHKAIKKAKNNGWATNIIEVNEGYENTVIFSHDFAEMFFAESYDGMVCEKHGVKFCCVFKEKKYCCDCGKELKPKRVFKQKDDNWGMLPEWQRHLQQMVITKEPLQYLKKFL